MSAAGRGAHYQQQAREVLGDEMFEHCRRVGLNAPPPTPEQVALIGRIFGPALRKLAERREHERLDTAA